VTSSVTIARDGKANERLVSTGAAGPMLIEQFRNLAAHLNRTQSERALKSIVVTSPAPGDGKSHVAVNLALTLSDSYRRRVLLIDADLRRPTLHDVFGVAATPGLLETLRADGDQAPSMVSIGDHLWLLPAGRSQANPIGDLSSGRMARLVKDATSRFDWVIVDSPPAAGLADARIVAETVDGAIVVVRAGVTHFPDLEAAATALGSDRILGVVLNAVDPREIRRDDYYSHYYGGAGDSE
jgi:protein-tyrosine kinase